MESDDAALAVADDAALAAWFALLPERGSAARVRAAGDGGPATAQLARVAVEPRGCSPRRSLAVAVSAGFLLPALVPLARLVGPAGVLNLWISSVADLAIAPDGRALDLEHLRQRRAGSRTRPGLPPFLALLALNAALALAAFRGLVALSSKRSPSHAGIVALSV